MIVLPPSIIFNSAAVDVTAVPERDNPDVAVILTTPPEEILIASVSLAEPIVPASGITIFVPKVAVELVIANSSVPPILILTPVSAWTFI